MQEVLDVFEKLNIEYNLIRHPAIFCRADEEKVKGIDFALLALHGQFGEDGTVQSVLQTGCSGDSIVRSQQQF